MKEAILSHRSYAHEHGQDSPEVTDWRWSLNAGKG
jgi:xylulose-5-phosphate/fructose-6-phosphate phosphoketolase